MLGNGNDDDDDGWCVEAALVVDNTGGVEAMLLFVIDVASEDRDSLANAGSVWILLSDSTDVWSDLLNEIGDAFSSPTGASCTCSLSVLCCFSRFFRGRDCVSFSA